MEGKIKSYSVAAILGSGGHTAEMFRIIPTLKAELRPTTFILGPDDILGRKLISMYVESSIYPSDRASPSILEIKRPRRVGQDYLTSMFSTIWTLLCAIYLLLPGRGGSKLGEDHKLDLVICNGPGICVCIAVAARLAYFLQWQPAPIIIFVESFARTRKLSLSGRIMRLISDKIFVQWPTPTFSISGIEYPGGPLV